MPQIQGKVFEAIYIVLQEIQVNLSCSFAPEAQVCQMGEKAVFLTKTGCPVSDFQKHLSPSKVQLKRLPPAKPGFKNMSGPTDFSRTPAGFISDFCDLLD